MTDVTDMIRRLRSQLLTLVDYATGSELRGWQCEVKDAIALAEEAGALLKAAGTPPGKAPDGSAPLCSAEICSVAPTPHPRTPSCPGDDTAPERAHLTHCEPYMCKYGDAERCPAGHWYELRDIAAEMRAEYERPGTITALPRTSWMVRGWADRIDVLLTRDVITRPPDGTEGERITKGKENASMADLDATLRPTLPSEHDLGASSEVDDDTPVCPKCLAPDGQCGEDCISGDVDYGPLLDATRPPDGMPGEPAAKCYCGNRATRWCGSMNDPRKAMRCDECARSWMRSEPLAAAPPTVPGEPPPWTRIRDALAKRLADEAAEYAIDEDAHVGLHRAVELLRTTGMVKLALDDVAAAPPTPPRAPVERCQHFTMPGASCCQCGATGAQPARAPVEPEKTDLARLRRAHTMDGDGVLALMDRVDELEARVLVDEAAVRADRDVVTELENEAALLENEATEMVVGHISAAVQQSALRKVARRLRDRARALFEQEQARTPAPTPEEPK